VKHLVSQARKSNMELAVDCPVKNSAALRWSPPNDSAQSEAAGRSPEVGSAAKAANGEA